MSYPLQCYGSAADVYACMQVFNHQDTKSVDERGSRRSTESRSTLCRPKLHRGDRRVYYKAFISRAKRGLATTEWIAHFSTPGCSVRETWLLLLVLSDWMV